MTWLITILTTLTLLFAAAAPAVDTAEDYDKDAKLSVESRVIPVPDRPHWARPLRVNVHSNRSAYYPGDDVRLYFDVSEDAYVWVYSTDTRGITRQIFPNRYHHDNFVQAHRLNRIPGHRDDYRLIADGSPGWDTIHVVAVAADGYRDWEPPYYRDWHDDPFPVCPKGYEGARAEISFSLENYHKKLSVQAKAGKSAVVHPREPGWGEAFHHLRILGHHYHPDPYRSPVTHRKTGKLFLTSTPARSKIFVDGRFCGYTPATLTVDVGYHDVRVVKDGYSTWKRRVRLSHNHRSVFRIHMDRDRHHRIHDDFHDRRDRFDARLGVHDRLHFDHRREAHDRLRFNARHHAHDRHDRIFQDRHDRHDRHFDRRNRSESITRQRPTNEPRSRFDDNGTFRPSN